MPQDKEFLKEMLEIVDNEDFGKAREVPMIHYFSGKKFLGMKPISKVDMDAVTSMSFKEVIESLKKKIQKGRYPSQIATLKKDTLTVEDIGTLKNDEALSDIDERIENKEPDALELSNALDEAIIKFETQTDSIDFNKLADIFDLEILSSSNGGGLIMKDDIEIHRYSDDADLGVYFDSIAYQSETLFDLGEGGV